MRHGHISSARDRPERLTWARTAPSGALSSFDAKRSWKPHFSDAPPGVVRACISRSGRSLALEICPWRALHAYVRSYGPQGPPEAHGISARSRPLREVEIASRSHMPQQVPVGCSYVRRRVERATGISLAPGIVPNGSCGRARRREAHGP